MKTKKKGKNGAVQRRLDGLLYPFSSFRSRYNVFYHDRHGLGVPGGGTQLAGLRHGPMTLPGWATTRSAQHAAWAKSVHPI